MFYFKNQRDKEMVAVPLSEKKVVPSSATTIMKLTAPAVAVKIGQTFNVSIAFSDDRTDFSAFDAVVSYDPEMIRVDEIRPSNIFQTYPRKLIQKDRKRLIVTGVQTDLAQNLSAPNGELAILVFTPLKPGKTKLDFMVDGDRYTNMMNKTPANVLEKAEGVEIDIQ
jgi:hypothetical protein